MLNLHRLAAALRCFWQVSSPALPGNTMGWSWDLLHTELAHHHHNSMSAGHQWMAGGWRVWPGWCFGSSNSKFLALSRNSHFHNQKLTLAIARGTLSSVAETWGVCVCKRACCIQACLWVTLWAMTLWARKSLYPSSLRRYKRERKEMGLRWVGGNERNSSVLQEGISCCSTHSATQPHPPTHSLTPQTAAHAYQCLDHVRPL